MIYQVNQFNSEPIYFADSATIETAPIGITTRVGTQTDAENLLTQTQSQVLIQEAIRFSICANFEVPGGVVWRNLEPTDPDNTVCQVFNTFTGTYTEYQTVTEANAANKALQQEFLSSVNLDSIKVLDAWPEPPKQPTVVGAQTL